MAIDGIEVHVVSRPFDERFNMEFVFVFNDTLDDGNRLLISRYTEHRAGDPYTSSYIVGPYPDS
jgi:hypothetical protein